MIKNVRKHVVEECSETPAEKYFKTCACTKCPQKRAPQKVPRKSRLPTHRKHVSEKSDKHVAQENKVFKNVLWKSVLKRPRQSI